MRLTTAALLLLLAASTARAANGGFSGDVGGVIVNSGPEAEVDVAGAADAADADAADGATNKPVVSRKKGLGVKRYFPKGWDADVGARWFYRWGPRPQGVPEPESTEFVPMIRSGGDELAQIARLSPRPKALLAFDEPDVAAQDKADGETVEMRKKTPMDDATAVALTARAVESDAKQAAVRCPSLVGFARRFGARLGAPGARRTDGWWEKVFLKTVDEKHFPLDFIALHWFGPPDPAKFEESIRTFCEAHRRPVWLTEFAVENSDAEDDRRVLQLNRRKAENFLRAVLPWLESYPCVERYAWFHTDPRDPDPALEASMLWDRGGGLTRLGEIYAACALPANSRLPAACRYDATVPSP